MQRYAVCRANVPDGSLVRILRWVTIRQKSQYKVPPGLVLLNEEEVAAAGYTEVPRNIDARTENTIRAQAIAAYQSNVDFLAIDPSLLTVLLVGQQVRKLTQQMNGVLRLLNRELLNANPE